MEVVQRSASPQARRPALRVSALAPAAPWLAGRLVEPIHCMPRVWAGPREPSRSPAAAAAHPPPAAARPPPPAARPCLQYLVAGDRWESLDPLVRSRLLLAPLFMRKRELAELRPALEKLAAAGAADK